MTQQFCPPVIRDWPQVLEYDPEKRRNITGYRLMRYYSLRNRGVNVFKMSDGTYLRSDVNEPYPATDQVVNDAIAHSWYNGVDTVIPVPNPYVVHIYYGSHCEIVSDAEAALLTAAGFGAYLNDYQSEAYGSGPYSSGLYGSTTAMYGSEEYSRGEFGS